MGHAGEHTAGAETTGFELPDWEFVFAPACYLNRLIAKIAYNFDYTKIKPHSPDFSHYSQGDKSIIAAIAAEAPQSAAHTRAEVM